MGHLVDARLPRVHRMAHPEGDDHKDRPAVRGTITAEDHPPAAVGLGQIGFDTACQESAVPGLRIATEEFGPRDSLPLKPSPLAGANSAARRGRVMEILGERLVVEPHSEPRAVNHP